MKLTDLERSEFLHWIENFRFTDFLKNKTFVVTGAKGIMGQGIIKWILLENELHGTNSRIIALTRTPAEIPEYIQAGDSIEYVNLFDCEPLYMMGGGY